MAYHQCETAVWGGRALRWEEQGEICIPQSLGEELTPSPRCLSLLHGTGETGLVPIPALGLSEMENSL